MNNVFTLHADKRWKAVIDYSVDEGPKSVEPYFDSLKRCFPLVEDPKKSGDFGIDLLIDKAGGKAKVSHPRTTMKGAGFKECMVAAFEAIDFKKPRGGNTMVSYSVRFTP